MPILKISKVERNIFSTCVDRMRGAECPDLGPNAALVARRAGICEVAKDRKDQITNLGWTPSEDPNEAAKKQEAFGKKFVHDFRVESLNNCSACHR